MKRLLNGQGIAIVTVIAAASFLVLGYANRGTAQPGSKGTIGDCYSPYTYTDKSYCLGATGACAPLNTCFTAEIGDTCDDDPDCPAGGCKQYKASTVKITGYCEVTEAVTTYCTRCGWFACANGSAYKNMLDCAMGVNPQCSSLYWSNSACEVVP